MSTAKDYEHICEECDEATDELSECDCENCRHGQDDPLWICHDCLRKPGTCRGRPKTEPPDILCSQCGEVLLWYTDHFGCEPCGRTVTA